MKVISEILVAKYGKPYGESVRAETVTTISEKLKHKLSIQSPPKMLVERYMMEIAKNYNLHYEPDHTVMKDEPLGMLDTFLIDLSDKNNLGGGGTGGGAPQPPGFVGFPHPPELPSQGPNQPFNYPVSEFNNGSRKYYNVLPCSQ